jgi:hypothetical protein
MGDCAIIPADGSRGRISVRRDKTTGEWIIIQDFNYDDKNGVKMTKAQCFALQALLSQESWS